jgi:hypothetical protein
MATKEKARKGKHLTLPVSFGGVSVRDKTARIGVDISRQQMTLTNADKNLCGRRLVGSILARPEGAAAEQDGMFDGDGDTVLEGIFDVKAFGVHSKHYSAGLTFALEELSAEDRQALTYFAKREGLLLIDNLQQLPEKPKPEKNDDADDDNKGEE